MNGYETADSKEPTLCWWVGFLTDNATELTNIATRVERLKYGFLGFVYLDEALEQLKETTAADVIFVNQFAYTSREAPKKVAWTEIVDKLLRYDERYSGRVVLVAENAKHVVEKNPGYLPHIYGTLDRPLSPDSFMFYHEQEVRPWLGRLGNE